MQHNIRIIEPGKQSDRVPRIAPICQRHIERPEYKNYTVVPIDIPRPAVRTQSNFTLWPSLTERECFRYRRSCT